MKDIYNPEAARKRSDAYRDNMKIPAFKAPARAEIQMVAPFGGALARVVIKRGRAYVSVYFDDIANLGAMDEPYWEIYPAADGDIDRFVIGEEEQLSAAIAKSLRAQQRRNKRAKAEGEP